MIVVTAPTGQIGRHVVDNLIAADAHIRVIVRDPAKLSAAVRENVDIVTGSHGDAAVVRRAFAGVDAVFWVAPPNPSQTLEQVYIDFTRAAASEFADAGVKRVVAVTALGRGTPWQDKAGLVTASIAMDDMIMASGVAFRGLAMPSFMDNVLRSVATIRDQGVLYGQVDPDRAMPMTATVDMGAVAARLLADETWSGQDELPVLGPADITAAQMAATISEVTGRAVRYEQTSLEDLERRVAQNGGSPSFARGYADMMRAKNEGMDNVAGRDANTRTPTTFRQWCETVLTPALAA